MPYRRKAGKNGYKRPGYRACGKMVYGDARKALLVARGVRRLLNVEIKNHDVQQVGVALSNTMVITQLSNIAQGGTTNTRDGAQCKMLGIDFNYLLTISANASRPAVRIMLVLDKQTNQAIYTIADLIEDVSASDNIVSPRNLDNKHRFTILYDRTHVLGLQGNTNIVVRKYIKKDILLRYDASTPSIADLTQNSLSLVQVTNDAAEPPTITSFMRIRFVDN